MKNTILTIFLLGFYAQSGFGQTENPCRAVLKNDTLLLDNGAMTQIFKWNNGNLIRLSLSKSKGQETVVNADNAPCLQLTSTKKPPLSIGTLRVVEVAENGVSPARTDVEIVSFEGDLSIKRVFRLYPNCTAIACDFYLKGQADGLSAPQSNAADLGAIETEAIKKQGGATPSVVESLNIGGAHWKAKAIEFFDVTDRNNTLTQIYEQLLYRSESQIRGNLLFLENKMSNQQLFLLKEAPPSSTQLQYFGYDFSVKNNSVKVVGVGLSASDVNDSTWTKGYSIVVGIADKMGEYAQLSALRDYQQRLRTFDPKRDNMIMSNTWGDRSQDKKLNEAFVKREFVLGAKLGITHFQLDDGWQTGRSGNSAFGGTFTDIWHNPNYWKPAPDRFPNGLKPVVALGKESGIKISTWFNPSKDSSNKNWARDADVLIGQYREYGITNWKIDGVELPDKLSEINFRRFLDKVQLATKGEAVFNLDVTAGRRFGYHYGYEYGNLFLENRYTDWGNYYPYTTLRNLWMLARYVPPQRLQIEFLNKTRNVQKYAKDDILAPNRYDFGYLFAIAMVGQPLAWFELTQLPDSAFAMSNTVSTYKKHWEALHKGQIFPIGDEPSGFSWTGFQSIISDTEGYVLLFRENNESPKNILKLWNMSKGNYQFEAVLGDGKSFKYKGGNEVPFSLMNRNSYCLFKYRKS